MKPRQLDNRLYFYNSDLSLLERRTFKFALRSYLVTALFSEVCFTTYISQCIYEFTYTELAMSISQLAAPVAIHKKKQAMSDCCNTHG